MREISEIDIRRLDGGLLLVFRELVVRGKTSEAALRLGLSQSAVSHALARLRDLFGDPLFTRRPHGLEPTQRARQLLPRIETLIDLAAAAIGHEDRFDPRQSTRRFHIGAPEFAMSMLGPGLVQRFLKEAPGASFVTRRLLLDLAVAAIRRGEIDVALGGFGRLPAGFVTETVLEDEYCVIARRGHPVIKGSVSVARYAETPHIWVGHPSGGVADESIYDPDLFAAAYGSIPDSSVVRSAAYVSQWETAMLMVSQSDAIADCPRRLAKRYARRLGLALFDPPYEAAPIRVQALWRADTRDAGIEWLLATLKRAAGRARQV